MSFADEVLKSVRNTSAGSPTWFDRLPQDAQKELDKVRAAFDPALHQKRAYARAVIAAATKRGWPIAAEKQVIVWLEKERSPTK